MSMGLSVVDRLRKGQGVSTHNCMCFPETNGRSKIVVYERVHAHDPKTVAGVIRVQKMDIEVDRVASNNLCHGTCGCCREMAQICGTSREGGEDSTCPLLCLQQPCQGENHAHHPRLTSRTGDERAERKGL